MAKVYDTATDLITFARNSTATYLDSSGVIQSAAVDTPRIEYGSDGSLKGLLIEEQRTNLVAESATLSNWGGLGAQANSGVGSTSLPDGSIGGVSVSRAAPSNMYKTGLSVSESTAYTASIFVKAETAASIKFGLEGTGFSNSGVHTFDILNGSVNTVSNWTATIEPVGNDWWRLSVSSTTSIGATSVTLNLGAVTDNQVFYAWGAQLEEGSFATSYIPTSGSQQTRSADVASIPVSTFGYNQQAGTVVVDFATLATFGSRTNDGVLSLRDNSTDKYDLVRLYLAVSDNLNVQVRSNNSNVFATGIQTDLPEQSETKVATGFTSGSYAASVDGGVAQSLSTNTAYPVAGEITELAIGEINGSDYLNGHIKSLQYYPRRLTDAQLQELTA